MKYTMSLTCPWLVSGEEVYDKTDITNNILKDKHVFAALVVESVPHSNVLGSIACLTLSL